jgi:hypothetical protein
MTDVTTSLHEKIFPGNLAAFSELAAFMKTGAVIHQFYTCTGMLLIPRE